MKGKKQMTIDDLSIVVKKGFQDVDRKMATKDMLAGLATKDMVKIMVDDLALMTQKGFQEIKHTMVTKDMLKDMVTKDMIQLVVDDMDLIRVDIRDIKISLGPLVRMVAALDTDMQHLMTRVARLEQKAGFGK